MVEDKAARARRLTPPSWLDLRLVLGVLLVLVAVVVGARVFTDADKSVRVWAAARDLPAGSRLTPDDLRTVRVRLYGNTNAYLSASTPLAGRQTTRDLSSGDLLPRSALTHADPAGAIVPLSVPRDAVPPGLRRGDRIDVYAAGAKDSTGDQSTYRVLRAVTIQSVDYGSNSALSASRDTVQLTIELPPECAAKAVPRVSGQTLFVLLQMRPVKVDACADAASWPQSSRPQGQPK